MSYAAEVTGELALWVAGWIRELLTDAPPPAQRSTAEWLLERIDAAALQALPGVEQVPPSSTAAGGPVGDGRVSDVLDEPPLDGEGNEA